MWMNDQVSVPRRPPARRLALVAGQRPRRARLASELRSHGYDCLEVEPDDAASVIAAADLLLVDVDDLPERQAPATVASYGKTAIPVVTLASDASVEDRVGLLRAGADDHVSKQTPIVELAARLDAVLRRAPRGHAAGFRVRAGSLDVDFGSRTVEVRGAPVSLTATEWRLLEELATHPGAVLDHRYLSGAVWGDQRSTDTRSLRVHISNLRRKLADAGVSLIETDHGLGYRWRGPAPDRDTGE
jgi:two-component system, OmpR family, KDP operon response regulator KdpE